MLAMVCVMCAMNVCVMNVQCVRCVCAYVFLCLCFIANIGLNKSVQGVLSGFFFSTVFD